MPAANGAVCMAMAGIEAGSIFVANSAEIENIAYGSLAIKPSYGARHRACESNQRKSKHGAKNQQRSTCLAKKQSSVMPNAVIAAYQAKNSDRKHLRRLFCLAAQQEMAFEEEKKRRGNQGRENQARRLKA